MAGFRTNGRKSRGKSLIDRTGYIMAWAVRPEGARDSGFVISVLYPYSAEIYYFFYLIFIRHAIRLHKKTDS